MTELTIQADAPDPRTLASLAFICQALGIRARIEANSEAISAADGEPRLIYGVRSEVRPTDIVIVRRAGDVIWPALLDGSIDRPGLDGRIDFDLVAAIGSLLGDQVEHGREAGAIDRHGRLTYPASAPARAGYGDRPIVNAYVNFIGSAVRERLGIGGQALWPSGRVAAIGLSHDVDSPDRYALLGSALRPWRLRRHPRTYARAVAELARARLQDPTPRDFWLFDEVARSEQDLGFRSTFFFATVPFHHRRGAPQDVAYDIRGGAYRRITRSLVASGFEVGLHASYRAHEAWTHMAEERALLGEVAGDDVIGVRHHYWHLGPDVARTLRFHERAGFDYDSSLAFNDHVGFRRGVALPFHPFDPTLQRPVRTLQLPTFCMDGNLFYGSTDVDASVAAVDALVGRIVESGGMGAIDWHIQTSFPGNREFRAWGVAYQAILRLLADRTDVWVTDLRSIARWLSERRRSIDGGPVPAGQPRDATPA